jgi:hypothetical protein
VTPRAARRLLGQQIVRPRFRTVADLVGWMGAVQAQDYPGSLWGIGLRLPGATAADVEDALATRAIVRTWPMRGTLHYVAARDVRWMLRLLAPRVVARSAGRYRQLGLDEAAFTRSRKALVRALEGGRRLARHEAYAVIERAGVSAAGQRGVHILGHLAQQGVLCLGPRQGKQPTFVLLEEWVPAAPDTPRDQALGALAARYFASHGPATVPDFAWWSGLPVREAQAGIDAAGPKLRPDTGEGRGWWSSAPMPAGRTRGPVAALLPPWDEYLVAYKDRADAFGHRRRRPDAAPSDPIGRSLILIDGRVRGVWTRTLEKSALRVQLDFWTPVTAVERRAVDAAAARYGRFLSLPLTSRPARA